MAPIESEVLNIPNSLNGMRTSGDVKKLNLDSYANEVATELTIYSSQNKILLKLGKYLKQLNKYLYLGIKRLFDIVGSLFGLLLILPLALIVKVSYMASGDFDSIFYTQTRIGKNGKQFKLYKFRSMVKDADKVLKELLKDPKYKKEWEENQKFDNDPRITKIGKILRSTSLDEIPQMINVFKGDMSFIGPRPLVVGELDDHNGIHELYESVKPGISGWWASHGRSATTYEERLDLEYYYCEKCNLSMDIECFFSTLKAVFQRTGAK